MRTSIAAYVLLLLLLCPGCKQASPPQESIHASPAEIAKELHAIITQPSLMQLESREVSESSPRESRQREHGVLYMQRLVSLGDEAEPEIWKLVNDEDASVRRSCAGMIQMSRTNSQGLPVSTRLLESLHIPILERMLESSDDQVRFIACGSLGDLAGFNNGLDRLLATLDKLRQLKNDESPSVRSIAWMASNNISAVLSTKAKSAKDRDAATEVWTQLQSDGSW